MCGYFRTICYCSASVFLSIIYIDDCAWCRYSRCSNNTNWNRHAIFWDVSIRDIPVEIIGVRWYVRILLLTSLWWYTAGHCWRVPVFSTGITPGRKYRLTQYPESTLLIHRCISAGLKNPSSLSWPCLKTVIRTRTGIFKREGSFYCFAVKL